MRILAALSRRAARLVTLALLVASATFFLSSLIPGDFFSVQESDPSISRQTVERMRRQHGLDRSLWVQYALWLRSCIFLDFGDSLFYRRPVRSVVLEALANTLWMGIPALMLGLAAGMLLGVMHAVYRNRSIGLAFDLISSAALALPTLVLGLAALLFAARTEWFPLGSMNSLSLQDPGFLEWLANRIHHLLLPVGCLSVPIIAYVERIECAAAQEALLQPYVRAARARGLPRRRILLDYVARPALNPVLSVSGPLFGNVLSGSLVLEVMFAWPGLGQATYDALFNLDLPLVIGCVVGSTLLLVVGNMCADALLLILDPRTRIRTGDAR